jgi:hypothetical protein
MRGVLLATACTLATASPTFTQLRTEQVGRYEYRYGRPTTVSLEELVQSSAEFQGKAVRTKGRLQLPSRGGVRGYVLRELGAQAVIFPISEVSGEFEDHARRWMGHQIEIVGLVEPVSESAPQSSLSIMFWEFDGPRDVGEAKKSGSPHADLEDLGMRTGETVRIVGQFRGQNLYGDLPASSQRGREDWVLKDGSHAVWVTGREPRGKGWALDLLLKSDTGRWLEVIGRAETRDGVTYVKARKVALTTASARAAPQ